MPRSNPSLAARAGFVALLEDARITKFSTIRVTGTSGLSALLWLCRHGYQEVGFLRPGRGCPHEDTDALVVADTCDAASLARLLATGPHVRPGGVLIVQSALPAEDRPTDPMHDLLHSAGYRVDRCVRGQRREVHVAQRGRTRRGVHGVRDYGATIDEAGL